MENWETLDDDETISNDDFVMNLKNEIHNLENQVQILKNKVRNLDNSLKNRDKETFVKVVRCSCVAKLVQMNRSSKTGVVRAQPQTPPSVRIARRAFSAQMGEFN